MSIILIVKRIRRSKAVETPALLLEFRILLSTFHLDGVVQNLFGCWSFCCGCGCCCCCRGSSRGCGSGCCCCSSGGGGGSGGRCCCCCCGGGRCCSLSFCCCRCRPFRRWWCFL